MTPSTQTERDPRHDTSRSAKEMCAAVRSFHLWSVVARRAAAAPLACEGPAASIAIRVWLSGLGPNKLAGEDDPKDCPPNPSGAKMDNFFIIQYFDWKVRRHSLVDCCLDSVRHLYLTRSMLLRRVWKKDRYLHCNRAGSATLKKN
jgi:hypothetical protein